MTYKKLALATAIAAAPVAGFTAMTEVDDATLSGVTGQEGIKVQITTAAAGITGSMYVHDKDGLSATVTPANYSFDGAIVIENFGIMVGGGTVTLNIDAGDSVQAAGGAPILQVALVLPAALTIATGAIRVANSGRDDAVPSFGISNQTATILNNMTIVLGSTTVNIQLGNEQQTGSLAGTDMIVVSGSVTSGVQISGFRLSDANSGGGIGASLVTMLDNASTAALTIKADINATAAGLKIELGQLGTVAGGMDINFQDQYLGSTSAGVIGDISIVGLKLAGTTITVSGK